VAADEQRRAKERFEEAVKRLVDQTGMSDAAARALVDAAQTAAVNQLFETMLAPGQPPGTLAALRADQIRLISQELGSIPSEASIRTLLRVTPSATKTAIASMKAAYGAQLHTPLLGAMRADATVNAAGDETSGLKWNVRFTETANAEYAWQETKRVGLAHVAVKHGLVIEIPQSVGGTDPLGKLGLTPPK
jgi:hypothetical protein